jgi:DNA-binding transcriptional regulator YiaG
MSVDSYIPYVYNALAMNPSQLRRLRTRLKLSQSGLAALLHVHKNTVARWERGELGMRPSTARLIEVLTATKRKS